MGGTLLKVHPSVGGVYASHAHSHGFQGSADALDQQFRIAWKKTGGLESLGNQTGPDIEHKFWYDLVFNVFEPFGGLTDFDDFFERVYNAFLSPEHWRVFEDVHQSKLFNKLRSRGITLGVVSNWDSRLTKILENTGLAHHFDFILASAEVGSAKPDHKIFSEALRKSEVGPGEACHIGDEPQSDFLGAQNSGIDAILVDRKGRYGDEFSPTVSTFMDLI